MSWSEFCTVQNLKNILYKTGSGIYLLIHGLGCFFNGLACVLQGNLWYNIPFSIDYNNKKGMVQCEHAYIRYTAQLL